MYELILKYIDHQFFIIDQNYYEEYISDDGELFVETHREEVYINDECAQSIIFHEYRFDGEEMLDDLACISDYISPEMYLTLCDILNNNDNITVFWSQVYGTTSDYIVIYDKFFTDPDECREYIENNTSCYLQYMQIKDGVCSPIPLHNRLM